MNIWLKKSDAFKKVLSPIMQFECISIQISKPNYPHYTTDNYEAEQLLKEVDIHSVTGIFKTYLRELPEALFTDLLYPKLFDVFNSPNNEETRIKALNECFAELSESNRVPINYILDHLIR